MFEKAVPDTKADLIAEESAMSSKNPENATMEPEGPHTKEGKQLLEQAKTAASDLESSRINNSFIRVR